MYCNVLYVLKSIGTSGSRPLWARSNFGLWYAAKGVVKMLHTDNKVNTEYFSKLMI